MKEKQSWYVGNWMKVIFGNESRICIGQGDYAETFCRSNETYKDECVMKKSKFPELFMIWSCISLKGQRR